MVANMCEYSRFKDQKSKEPNQTTLNVEIKWRAVLRCAVCEMDTTFHEIETLEGPRMKCDVCGVIDG